jgi:hypothetical protein
MRRSPEMRPETLGAATDRMATTYRTGNRVWPCLEPHAAVSEVLDQRNKPGRFAAA